MFKYAFICLCVKPWIHYFICRWWCNITQYARVQRCGDIDLVEARGHRRKKKRTKKTTPAEARVAGSKFSEIHQVSNKFALSSYHSWIFRAIKCENIKLNYACMKRWKSAVGHCSFSLVFSCYMFVSATRSLISAHDARPRGDLQTSDSGMYVGAVTPPSIPPRGKNYSIPWWRSVRKRVETSKKNKNMADTNRLVEQVVWEVKPTQVEG